MKRSRFSPAATPKRYIFCAVACTVVVILGDAVVTAYIVAQQTVLVPSIPAKSGKSVETSITISPEVTSRTIPQQFAGFSMEMGNVCSFLQTEQHHPEINTLITNLQPVILRLGGTTADHLSWHPERGCPTWYAHSFGKKFVNNLFAYARQHNVKVIWTVNLNNNQPAAAAEEATYAYKIGGSNLIGIAIGNEPNEYKDGSYTGLSNRWASYYTTIHAQLPNAPIVAPDTSGLFGCGKCPRAYFQPFMQNYGADTDIATTHYYPLSNKTASVQGLLAKSTMDQFSKSIQSSSVIKQGAPPLVISETNSAYGGGRHGVSDTFAAGLWGLDYLYTAAESGAQGAYFHSSLGTSDLAYSPIGQNMSGIYVTGLYYAILLFHDTAQGNVLVQTTIKSPVNVTAHATIAPDGVLHISIINKDLVTGTKVAVSIPSAYYAATAIRLEAPEANNINDVTLGGSAVSRDGQWRPAKAEHLSPVAGKLTISIPAASAAEIALQK